MKSDLPCAWWVWGDPHLDSNGCNWPLLEHHAKLCAETEGVSAVNHGDTTDNWVGRLMRLYAHSDQSRETAQKLVEWFMHISGIPWKIWLMGNHDEWNYGSEILRVMGQKAPQRIIMEDWQARFQLVFPNGRRCRIWAAHDLPGHSQWNTLHGAQKAAHMKDEAHVYIVGHKHNWALHQEESASKGFVYWLARTRGYKYIDFHAEKLGHDSQQEGASILIVVNPQARSAAGFVHLFADVEEGLDFLECKRRKHAK